jgi:hypothetical protein
MRGFTVVAILYAAFGIIPQVVGQVSSPPVQSKGVNPPYSLAIRAVPNVARVGARIEILVTIKNISGHEISNSKHSVSAADYTISIKNSEDETPAEKEALGPVNDLRSGKRGAWGSYILGTLKPGETCQDGVEITNYYDMSQPGKYTITFSSESWDGSKERPEITIRSNTVTVTIVP